MTTALTTTRDQPSTSDPLTGLPLPDLWQLARTLVASGFLPRAIKTPEQAVAVILTGRELGLGPMLSIRSISVIDGKPVVAADLQLARFKAAGGRATFMRLDDTGAVLALRHPNGDEHTETYTMEDAKLAGLTGKDNWRKFSRAMLRSRAITAGLKSVGFEATAGMYDPDEAEHFTPRSDPLPPADSDGVSIAAEDVAHDATVATPAVEKPSRITRESAWPYGKRSGTPIRELPAEYLLWCTEHGRHIGVGDGPWIAAARAELELREDRRLMEVAKSAEQAPAGTTA